MSMLYKTSCQASSINIIFNPYKSSQESAIIIVIWLMRKLKFSEVKSLKVVLLLIQGAWIPT
jgi:hypothetical protein